MVNSTRTFLEFNVESRPLFEQLAESLSGPAAPALKNKDVFFIALSWGFYNGNKASKIKKSGTGVRVEYLDQEDIALIRAIHRSAAGDVEDLLNPDAGFEIAELYAEGGIRLLAEEMKKPGSFGDFFAAEITQLVESG